MSTPGALSAVAEKFKSLFESSQATDFTIVCDTTSWKVHSFVLNLYSDVLACACDGDFKEAAARSIDLGVDGETSVGALVHYMYYFDYATDDECHEPCTLHVNMVLLADKYDIPHLLELANEKLVDLLGNEAIAVTADLIAAAKLAYDAEGPTSIFREALVNATIKSSTLKPEEYDTIIRALPALAQDVAIAMPKSHLKAKEETKGLQYCRNCGTQVPLQNNDAFLAALSSTKNKEKRAIFPEYIRCRGCGHEFVSGTGSNLPTFLNGPGGLAMEMNRGF